MNKKPGLLFLILLLNMLIIQDCSVFQKMQKVKTDGSKSTLWIKKIDLYNNCNKGQKIGKLDVRFIGDAVMVIIVRNSTGIEGGRLYLYKDSLYIFNRISKKYFVMGLMGKKDNDVSSGKELENIGSILLQHRYKNTRNVLKINELKGLAHVEILKFKEDNENNYVPEEFMIYILLKKRRYCFYGVVENIVKNFNVPVSLINFRGRYKKVKCINDII